MLRFSKKDVLLISGLTLGALLLSGALLMLAFFNGIDEYYSRGRLSPSSEAARARDVFVHAPLVRDSLVSGTARTIRMLDAWIEEDHHTEYRFFYFPRMVREGTYTLVLYTTSPGTRDFNEQVALVVPSESGTPDTLRTSGWSGDATTDRYAFSVQPPFPDSLKLVAVRR